MEVSKEKTMEKGGLKMGQEGWTETGKEEEGRSQSVTCFNPLH